MPTSEEEKRGGSPRGDLADLGQRRMDGLPLARVCAPVVLDLHEKTLQAAEGGPEKAEEWVKLRADYVSACTTSAAVLAAAFQEQEAVAGDMLAALKAWESAIPRIDEFGSVAPNSLRGRALAAIAAAEAAGIKSES